MEKRERENERRKAALALPSMQRHSWEQGAAMQAFLEMGEMETVCAIAREAVYRSLLDGRATTIGVTDGVTDPCAVGEALIAACRYTGDFMLGSGLEAPLDWTLRKAPRNEEGILYHLTTGEQFRADSMHMLPPFLAAAGGPREVWEQMDVHWNVLYDRETGLMCHIWDDGEQVFIRAAHWGSGNGWVLAGMTRFLGFLLSGEYREEKQILRERIIRLLERVPTWRRKDGLFHDMVSDGSSFVETNLSQMVAYTVYCGVREGWLNPAQYGAKGDAMCVAAERRMGEFGFIRGVCGAPTFDKPGFPPEEQAFYLLMEQAREDWKRRRQYWLRELAGDWGSAFV